MPVVTIGCSDETPSRTSPSTQEPAKETQRLKQNPYGCLCRSSAPNATVPEIDIYWLGFGMYLALIRVRR